MVNINPAGLLIVFREFLEIGLFYLIIKGALIKNNANSKLFKQLNQGLIYATLIGIISFMSLNYLANVTKTQMIAFEGIMALISAILLTYFLLEALSSKELIIKSNKIVITIFILTIREIVEIAFFTKIGNYSFMTIVTAFIVSFLFFIGGNKLLQTRKLMLFLNIILIIQVGYLFGYAIHEFIQLLPNDSILKLKLYNLNNSFVAKKTILGSLLNVIFAFTPNPEILQFIGQYSITTYFLIRLKNHNFNLNVRFINE